MFFTFLSFVRSFNLSFFNFPIMEFYISSFPLLLRCEVRYERQRMGVVRLVLTPRSLVVAAQGIPRPWAESIFVVPPGGAASQTARIYLGGRCPLELALKLECILFYMFVILSFVGHVILYLLLIILFNFYFFFC